MHFDKVWLSFGSDPDHGEDGEWAVVIYGQIYSIETLDGSGFEYLLQDSLYGETLDNPSGQYKVYRRPPEDKARPALTRFGKMRCLNCGCIMDLMDVVRDEE